MKIIYKGGSSFLFKGKKLSIALDPKDNIKADIELFSSIIDGNDMSLSKIVSWPGEYEINGIPLVSIKAEGTDKLIYRFTIDDLNVVILTGVSESLNDEILEKLGSVNVLLLPIKGTENELSAKKAHSIFEDIEPAVVIPFDFDQTNLNEFAKEFGAMPVMLDEYEVTESSLSPDKSECIVLNAFS